MARRPGESLRKQILASQNRFWRPRELRGAASTVQHVLADLTAAGELQHLRKGLYWRGAPTPLGMSPPPLAELVAALAEGPGVGPAGVSAANRLRLSTQVPKKAHIAVPARAPSDVGPVRFVSRARRTGRREARLSELEVALVEALQDWDRVIETSPEQAWAQLRELVGSGAVRPERLARASSTEPALARARLRVLLEQAGYRDQARQVPRVDHRTKKAALQRLPAAAAS
jgi:hypothetical protein